MTVSVWQDEADKLQRTCDVAVVGAGIVGCTLARLLGDEGLGVVLLEARHVAAGATGRNAGMVLTGLAEHYNRAVQTYGRDRAREAWMLTIENRGRLLDWAARLDVPVERTGCLLLAVDEPEVNDLRESARLLAEDGFAAQFETRDPLGRGFRAALLQPDDVAMDPVAFTAAMQAKARAELLTGCEVRAFDSGGDGLIVYARRATVRCQTMVLAVNAYAPLLDPYFSGKVYPTRGQVLATAPLPPLFARPGYADHGYEYFRQLPDGRLLLGGWRQHYRAEEVGYSDETTGPIQAGLESFLVRHFPEAQGAITHRWAGVMGFSQDGLPLLGSLPREPRVFFAVGFTGHGLGLGIVAAERLVDLMVRGKQPGLLSARRLG
ncbi:MAG: FAD-binding oxidoreductase [Chloroflexi bacterium]|nr:FAD-binding oxidoreductase [Chloroflexota bacterium]